jgi:hypothetical protein
MKRTTILLLLLFLSTGTAIAADTPQNLTATTFETEVFLNWNDDPNADNFSVYRYLPSMLYTEETLVLDGVIDDTYKDAGANKAVAFSPNPVNENDYDVFRILRNDTYVFMTAETIDADTITNDDIAAVYVDFDQDGLTKDVDLKYQLSENGIATRQRWNGASWSSYSGTGATGVTVGEGTGNVVYELWVPIAEMPGFTNETQHDILIERSHDSGPADPRIYTYQPRTGIPTDTTNWAPLNITILENQTPLIEFKTTESQYTIENLEPFDFYHFGVSSFELGVESEISYIDAITEPRTTYNVSGNVYNSNTGDPIFDSVVTLTDSYPVDSTTTNIDGYFEFTGVINDSYTLTVDKEQYVIKNTSVIIDGNNATGLNIFLQKQVSNPMMPVSVFIFLVVICLGATGYAWMKHDDENYTDVISSFVAAITAGIATFALYGGITYTAGMAQEVFRSNSLAIFLALWSVIMGMFMFVKIADKFTTASDRWMKR